MKRVDLQTRGDAAIREGYTTGSMGRPLVSSAHGAVPSHGPLTPGLSRDIDTYIVEDENSTTGLKLLSYTDHDGDPNFPDICAGTEESANLSSKIWKKLK